MKELAIIIITLFISTFLVVFIYLNKTEIWTWLKNFRQEGIFKKRCNDLEIENQTNREAYTRSVLELSKQLTDMQAIIDYKERTIQLRDKTIRTLKERNKELEENEIKNKRL